MRDICIVLTLGVRNLLSCKMQSAIFCALEPSWHAFFFVQQGSSERSFYFFWLKEMSEGMEAWKKYYFFGVKNFAGVRLSESTEGFDEKGHSEQR